MARGKLNAGRPLVKNRTYPKELVARVKRRYLTHMVLGYRPRISIMEALAREFGIDVNKLRCLLQYEGMFK